MNDVMKCPVCDTVLRLRWTDFHGVGACCECNTPFQVYHYEGEGDDRKLVSDVPTCMTRDHWIPFTREYWTETKGLIPHRFDITDRNPCSRADYEAWIDFCDRLKREGRHPMVEGGD